jgi:signal transduction histidine kinase
MKLLNKTNLYFVGASLLVFCVGGVFFYFLFHGIIDRDLNDKLQIRKNYVLKQLSKSDSLLLFQQFSGNTVSIEKRRVINEGQEVFSDTVLYDAIDQSTIHYRQLTFMASANGQGYKIQLRRALVETSDLVKGVIALEAILFLAFVAILGTLNSQLSKKLWQPFYEMLGMIGAYKIDRGENLVFKRTSITEFNELSSAIEKMSEKISQEFSSQKEFTENASHEIQTPLAIIKNKMEVLLQTPGLSEEQMNLINTASGACNRLSKLNEALIILSKIENRQFHSVENICVNDLIEGQLASLGELIQIRKITVRRLYLDRLSIKMNRYLADILFENLITNSIKHNLSPGFMSITINSEKIQISNSGEMPRVSRDKLFDRFTKGNQKSKSLGLGLPIIKAICDTYLLPVHYTFETGIHDMSVAFPNGR